MAHHHHHGKHHGKHHHHDADHGTGHPCMDGPEGNAASHAELLDLDARVLGPYLDEVTRWAAQYAPTDPRIVVDMGAGTGTGTVALAERFTRAEVVAVDVSESMLDRVQAAAAEHGIADRVRLLQADLDAGWPQAGAADVVWAASSLHEVASPDRVLADVYAALNPGGLLVVLEMDSLPRFLPDDVETARPGLETRCHEALAQQGWNAHPNWRSHLEQAGFTVAAERSFVAESGENPKADEVAHPGAMAATGTAAKEGPPSSATSRYADGYLRRMRPALDGQLDPQDLNALDRVLATDSDESLLRRDDLKVRVARTAWAARRA
ncbi:class I SAM-dependent methyltransferase [Arthrobacter castelli]|uniref:class I SAM-dependent methyltransferase n=1 Tax=Arthrobacter castelli TaxID=271431 RepID=UPI000479B690|nr:class I SAM-dependent methyltransferase [Arthrobacter castelli]